MGKEFTAIYKKGVFEPLSTINLKDK